MPDFLVGRFSRFGTPHSRPLLAAMCVNAFGAGMFFPFAMLYYQKATSLSVGTIGLTITLATLLTLAATPITGALVDRFGARSLVITSLCVEAAGFAAYLAVSSAWTLFLAALVATAGTRMFFASFSTLIAEIARAAERDRLYGLVGVTQSIGASASGFVASLLLQSAGLLGFRTAIVGNVLCLLATALLIRGLGNGSAAWHQQTDSVNYIIVLHDRAFVVMTAANGLFIACSMLIGIALAIYATEAMSAPLWSVGAVGLLQTGMVLGLQAKVIHRLRSHRRTRAMLAAGYIWIVACLLFVFGIRVPTMITVPYLFIAVLTFTLAQLLYVPTARALAASLAPAGLRGRYIATYELSWGVAAAVGPGVFGVTYDLAAPAPWLIMCIVVAGAMVMLRWTEKVIPDGLNRPTDDKEMRSC